MELLYKEILENLSRKRDQIDAAIGAIKALAFSPETLPATPAASLLADQSKPKRKYTRRKHPAVAKPKLRHGHGSPGKFQCPANTCDRGFRTADRRATHLRKDHPEHLSDAA